MVFIILQNVLIYGSSQEARSLLQYVNIMATRKLECVWSANRISVCQGHFHHNIILEIWLRFILFSLPLSLKVVNSYQVKWWSVIICNNSTLFEECRQEQCWSLFNMSVWLCGVFSLVSFTFDSLEPRVQSKHLPSCLLTAACDLWTVIFSNFVISDIFLSLDFRSCCCACWWSSWPWQYHWERKVMGMVGNDDLILQL